MKPLLLTLAAFTIFLSCKNTSEEKVPPIETIEKNQEKSTTTKTETTYIPEILEEGTNLYIMVTKGLSLRKEPVITSKKLTVIPLGSEVTLLKNPEIYDMEIEHIRGGMSKIQYQDQIGYAFSGYLSSYRIALKDEKIEDYIHEISKNNQEVTFESKPLEQFDANIIEAITTIQSTWHEAFYIAKAMYEIPEAFSFPGHKGSYKQTIDQKNKEKYVWSSNLEISRNKQTLDTIHYFWHAEGSAYEVFITQPQPKQLKIRYVGLAD